MNKSYEEILAEVEQIARQMESGECDLAQIAAKLKKAQELILQCKQRLVEVDEDVKKILDSEQ